MHRNSYNMTRLAGLLGRFARFEFNRMMQFSEGEPDLAGPNAQLQSARSLYLHIPFCPVLCPFCSFHRVQYQEQIARRYFTALRKEIRLATRHGFSCDELYIGGGTPTVLPDELERTIALVAGAHPLTAVSVETNPNDLDPATLRSLKAVGVNRLSVGVQSFDDGLLNEMQRLEKYGSGSQIVAQLERIHGIFDTLNVDMMFNFPHQTRGSLEADLELLTAHLGVDQVSFYPLMRTASTGRRMRETLGAEQVDNEQSFYIQISEHMLAKGYRRSSGWCFSRDKGMVDEYITVREQYLGLGSGAFSYLDGKLYASTFSINNYLTRIQAGAFGCTQQRPLSQLEQARYYLLTRLFSGRLALAPAEDRFDGQFRRLLRSELLALRIAGAIHEDPEQLQLTERGHYLWVVLMREFFSSINRFREQMRHNISNEKPSLTRISPA